MMQPPACPRRPAPPYSGGCRGPVMPFDPTVLSPLDLKLADAWRMAGAELGFRVVAPFELPVGGRVFRYGAWVGGFIGPGGMVLRATPDEWDPAQCGAIWKAATAAGLAPVNLSPLLCRYDRDEFTSCLNLFEWV